MVNNSTGPTLTNVTAAGRQVVKFGLIGLVALMVGRMSVNAFIAYWKATHPPPPPPPTVGFGILPPPRFEMQDEEEKPTSYVLETPTGRTPDFGDRARVYFMPKAPANLLADQQAKEIAAKYGFVFAPQVVNDRTYRWTKNTPLNSTFEMDIFSHTFTLTTDYQSRPELLINNNLPTGFDAVNTVKNFLKNSNLLPDDVATASGEILPLKTLGGTNEPAVSLSDADYLQIDLNRTPIDNQVRMFTPEGYKGAISAIVTGALKGSESIVQIESRYYPVDYTQVHTYPIRTAESAWQLLQAGEGFIVDKGRGDQAVIRSIKIGYYDDFEPQEYLQPVYVFEGDGGFMAYVPAVDPKFLQNNTSTDL